ncbi:hypothetical protein NQ318_010712 [Aromia moschata]|uniref:Peptidase aspartic putative domain-containing protein n=1 Tax=Aromia moschata TaxID=1265417 RepID=A0AAV8XNS8_9CUCU|nr:hypothetical protein NQ318_010712 [Aromia moschata]
MDAKRKRALDEINLLECDLNEDFVPNYAVLDVVDEMMCQIISVEKSLKTSNPGDSHRTRPSLEGRPSPKLPKLPLPKFSGDIKEWPLFIECYNSMIHNNLELNDVDKVHYLIGCLSSSALNVCSGIPPTGDNYNIILKALIDKFEDKRILANSYIEQILHFKQASTESYSSLNIFLERFDSTVTALLKLNIDNLADYFIAYLALAKLNPETQKLFENSRRSSEMPSYEEIKIFVKEQAKICSRTQNNDKISTGSYSKNNSTGGKPKVTHSFVVHGSSSTSNLKCHLCKSDSHYLNTCSKFLKMSPEERYRQVRNNNLCLNCLATHKVINCRSNNTCRTCHARHHTLLHFKSNRLSACSSGDKTNSKLVDISDSSKAIENDQFNPLPSTSTTDVIVNNNGSSNPSEQALVNFCSLTNTRLSRRHCNTVLLSTVKVHIVDNDGCLHTFRFLIDSCSQANFLNLEAFRRLKLTMQKNSSEVRGIGSSCSNVRGISNIVVISQYDSSKRYPIEVLVVDKITEQLPRVEINLKALSHLDNLPLADNDFCRPNKIDGIIGADIFPYLLGQKRVVGPPGTPVAIETTLGFVVMGEAPTLSSSHSINHNFCVVVEPPLESLVRKFWEVEDIPSFSIVNPDDEDCENIFKSTYSRDSTGRYTVALPFKLDASLLGDSYQIALRRFLSLEKKINSNSILKKQYSDIIRDYISQGHMSKVLVDQSPKEVYYIPHHAVFKADSTSTPIRIVFDASCRTDSNYSLNDLLFTGPKLQSDVCTMFLKFRLFEVAITADLRQMYRQINLINDHCRFQRILWRSSPNEPIDIYELTTVSFGIKPSPFLAMRTVHQLSQDEKLSFPLASEFVAQDMYVDDFVSSVPSTSQAVELYHQLVEMFQTGGFQIMKWATNSKELLANIPLENHTSKIVSFESDRLKVLGLQWQPSLDVFSFSFDVPKEICSKRHILSTVARCYDPLGFLAPVTLLAKLLIKQLWILKLDWDEVPPPDIIRKWDQFKNDLPLLSTFEIPRHIGTGNNHPVIIIGFCDACSSSYGGAVHLRSVVNSEIKISLIYAKAKVSPMKVVTIPRLELCASHLLAKLINFVVDCYQSKLKITDIYALSDSTVTLNWITTHPSKLPTFVANRVAQIQTFISPNSWFHVDGQNNISDCLSRGLTPRQLVNNPTWTLGPDWLKLSPSLWPICRVAPNVPENKVVSVVVTKTYDLDNFFLNLIERKSKWLRLLNSVVYVLRFLKLLLKSSVISNIDLEKAEMVLLKIVQYKHFNGSRNNQLDSFLSCPSYLAGFLNG